MNVDELKVVWQDLNTQLEKNQMQVWGFIREGRVSKVRCALRPLFWGQVIQMAIEVLVIWMAVEYWTGHRGVAYQLLSAVIVHAYCVAMIALGGIMVGRMSKLDYSEPVTVLQKRIARIRSLYIRSGVVLGLSWWLFWIPFMMVAFGLLGTEMMANTPVAIYGGIVVGLLGLVATWLVHCWSHHASRSRLAGLIDDNAAGASLTNVRKIMQEIAQFESELTQDPSERKELS